MPVKLWPAIDGRLWADGNQSVGLFGEASVAARWSPRTREKAERGYGHWLGWLQATGQLDQALPPGVRVTPERVAEYVAKLASTCAPYTQACRIHELYDTLRVLAPDHDWAWLAQILATLRRRAEPIRDKRSRLRPIGELTELGRRLMAEAEAIPKWSAQRRAVWYRDGLIIALLAYRPVRMGNFSNIRLGRQLVKQHGRYWLIFDTGETKTRRAFEVAFPESLVPALERYLESHRPVLLRGDHRPEPAELDALWVSEIATPLKLEAFTCRIRKHTRLAFGKSLPAHWFRDAAATSIAIEDPKHVRDARHVLGHTSLATTERHYNQARSLEASRRHHAVLANLRASATYKNGSRLQETSTVPLRTEICHFGPCADAFIRPPCSHPLPHHRGPVPAADARTAPASSPGDLEATPATPAARRR